MSDSRRRSGRNTHRNDALFRAEQASDGVAHAICAAQPLGSTNNAHRSCSPRSMFALNLFARVSHRANATRRRVPSQSLCAKVQRGGASTTHRGRTPVRKLHQQKAEGHNAGKQKTCHDLATSPHYKNKLRRRPCGPNEERTRASFCSSGCPIKQTRSYLQLTTCKSHNGPSERLGGWPGSNG